MPAIETKNQLIAKLRESRAKLEKMVEKAGPEALLKPGICGEWSGKDVLAHVAHWQELHLCWWAAVQRGEMPEVPAPGLTWGREDVDQLNRQIYEAHCEKSLETVLQMLHCNFENFIAAVEATPEEDLFRPGVAAFTGKNTLARWYVEYAHHDGWGRQRIYEGLVRHSNAGRKKREVGSKE